MLTFRQSYNRTFIGVFSVEIEQTVFLFQFCWPQQPLFSTNLITTNFIVIKSRWNERKTRQSIRFVLAYTFFYWWYCVCLMLFGALNTDEIFVEIIYHINIKPDQHNFFLWLLFLWICRGCFFVFIILTYVYGTNSKQTTQTRCIFFSFVDFTHFFGSFEIRINFFHLLCK